MGDLFAGIVLNGQFLVAVPIAMLAGLVSFASPCILPLVPGYLAYVGGIASTTSPHPRRRVVLGVALFVAGFAVVFMAYGAAFGGLGSWLIVWQDLISRIMGVVIILMGVIFIGVVPGMQRTFRLPVSPAAGIAGAPLLGIVFGLGWTPCLGPTLAAISVLSIDSGSPWRGTALAFFYCVGLGVPFLLVALGFGWVSTAVSFLKRHIRSINIAGGGALIIIGLLMVTGLWTAWLYELQAVIGGVVLPI
ncbi:MAG: cytochrome c biogenesis protein CcdA [Cryobacterium sp.]|nr:cytochrome c biogenesis protein CcdA [Micrococcales bacterium]MBX3308952.1 cytochrome c biogenesis protein CcdA [Cryobacterium sp.]